MWKSKIMPSTCFIDYKHYKQYTWDKTVYILGMKQYTWITYHLMYREGFVSVSRRSSEVQNNAGRSMKDINATETVIKVQ